MEKFKMSICLALSCVLAIFLFTGCNDESKFVRLTDTVNQIRGMEDYTPSGTLAGIFSDNVVYEVTDIAWDGESGVAEVKVITPDLGQIISDAIQAAVDESGTDDYDVLLNTVKEGVRSALQSEDYPTLESTIEMDAEKTEDGYVLISNERFKKIVSGNLEEVFIQALMEGITNGEWD